MPYYWPRVSNIYEGAPSGWNTDNKAIISDLAWWVIEDESNPESLMEEVSSAYHNNNHIRPPHPDENGLFKAWFDEILISEHSIGNRDNLMTALLCGRWEDLTEDKACTILHMLPCEIIKSFMTDIKERIQNEYDEVASAATIEIEANEENEFTSDEDSSDSDDEQDYDSMPELEDSAGEDMEIDSDDESDDEETYHGAGVVNNVRRALF
tara:strand:- start:2121 stop:2750 length:630 start_codon:yes stop_codon:yes gene_type:complete